MNGEDILFNPTHRVARDLAKKGTGRDTILAHLTVPQAVLLAKKSGGTVNKETGLPSFGFFSSLGGIFGGNSSSSSPGGQQFSELQSYTAPLKTTADQQLAQYNSGTLNAADQLSLNRADQSAKAANSQYFASAGLGNSSQLANAQGQVDIAGAIAKQGMLNQYLNESLQTYSTILQPYTAALEYQYLGSQQAQNTLASGIGGLFGSGGAGSSLLGGLFGKLGGLFSGGGGGTAPTTSDFGNIGDVGGGAPTGPETIG